VPRLNDCASALVAALTNYYGLLDAGDHSGDVFVRVLTVVLEARLSARKALAVLDAVRDAGLLAPRLLAEASTTELTTIANTATGPVPARAWNLCQKIARWFESHVGDQWWDGRSVLELREELLGIRGVGPNLADDILLRGLCRAVFPVSRGAFRILLRHGWIDDSATYEEAREPVEAVFGGAVATLTRVSRWFEMIARDYCGLRAARCEHCPLAPLLPPSGCVSLANRSD
jgi:endonuclease-3 related protein